MPMERVEVSRRLRQLIKMMRTDRAHLTQRAAAEQCGLSEIHWRLIESGHTEVVPADTLARMCHAVGVTPRQLAKINEAHLADLVGERDDMLPPGDLDAYLMRAPGLTHSQRVALVTLANVLRTGA